MSIKKLMVLIACCIVTACANKKESLYLNNSQLDLELKRLEAKYSCGELSVAQGYEGTITIEKINALEEFLSKEKVLKQKKVDLTKSQVVYYVVRLKPGVEERKEKQIVTYGYYEFEIETFGTSYDPIICTGDIETSYGNGDTKRRSVLSNVKVAPEGISLTEKMYVSILPGEEIGEEELAVDIELKYVKPGIFPFFVTKRGEYDLYIYNICDGENMEIEAECFME